MRTAVSLALLSGAAAVNVEHSPLRMADFFKGDASIKGVRALNNVVGAHHQVVLGEHAFLTGKAAAKPLPEQGFEGGDVKHKDGETKTDDWLKEHATDSKPESKPQGGAIFLTFGSHAPAKTVPSMADRMFFSGRGLHASTHAAWPKWPGVQGSMAGFMSGPGPLPEQGFEGPPVEHKDGETHTDDWGCEYGSCGGKTTKATTAAPDGATTTAAPHQEATALTAEKPVATRTRSMADHMFFNSQGAVTRRGHKKSMADFMKPLPEQGYEGDGVEHKDGETATGDWGCEYGPCSSNTTTPKP